MSETPSAPSETTQDTDITSPAAAGADGADHGFDFSERYQEVVGKLNESLGKVDWSEMGKIGKVVGIFVAVIVAQILIKGVLDTINLLPIVPGLLELLGLVVVGKWSWDNLTTSEKRNAVLDRLQSVKREYLG
ncbi:MAG: CAAD domain-containing protein [Cyanobium sp.]